MADTLVERVAEILHRYSTLARGESLGVGVSGGADSVALLQILGQLAGRFGFRPVVLHLNHHWRGNESEGDEQFVRDLAASLDLPFVCGHGAVTVSNREAEARRLRREFFEECRATYHLKEVALGHNRSDQAETVFHRMLRGSGSNGLAAMRVLQGGYLRPLLTSGRAEIREWARAEGVRWREDSSNQDHRFIRNRLRLKTLPELAGEYNPNLESVLANTASLAQAEENYWEETLENIYSKVAKPCRLGLAVDVDGLRAQHLAVQRRLLRRGLSEVRAERLRGLDFEHIESILALCESVQGHDRVLVPGADALRSFDTLLLSRAGRIASEPRGYRIQLSAGEETELPYGAGSIYVDRVSPGVQVCDRFKKAQRNFVERVRLVDTLVQGEMLVRNWEPGDELRRPNHQSAVKVKTLFQEHRVKLWERRHWPLLCVDKEIAWVRGFGASSQFTAAATDNTACCLVYRPAEQPE